MTPQKRTIVLAGGGTLGSVTPLLALIEAAREASTHDQEQFVWMGTFSGPEHDIVATYKVPFYKIICGKLRRYWSIYNFISPFLTLFGFVQALFLLSFIRPALVVSAGGYVAVPVAWAAWCLRISVLVHEQDSRDGLANKLVRFTASKRTSVWPKEGAETIGNLIRPSSYGGTKESLLKRFAFSPSIPILLVTGGGTGSLALNNIVIEALPALTLKAYVIHLTGRGKLRTDIRNERYRAIDLSIADWPDINRAADVVITRAGMANLSEAAALKKATIVVPIPHSHQEDNAAVLEKHSAAVICNQEKLTADALVHTVTDLLDNPEHRLEMGERLHALIPDGTQFFLAIVRKLIT
ncbi:MAG: glycosyltransferase [Patescibacteria group bacterium]|jgi:UDP-N-acetylglucosamine--N-acetylmuramyl-(pentapeptide) pyrophosphoryl-undecaprenol N-acetylglucosamine transferase